MEIKRDSVTTDRYVAHARADASRQANFIFASSHQRFIVAIAAVGVQWSWSLIRRPDHLPVASQEEQDDSTYVPRELRRTKTAWSDVLHFGSADSDTAFRKVFECMTGLHRGRRLNHRSNDGATSDEDEAKSDNDDSQDSGASRSSLLALAHLSIAHSSPGRPQRTRLIRLMITPWFYQLHPPAKTRPNETEPQILRGRQLPVFPCLLPARFRLRASHRGNGERCMPQLRLSLCKCNHTGSSARCQCMFMIRYSCNIWISWLIIQIMIWD